MVNATDARDTFIVVYLPHPVLNSLRVRTTSISAPVPSIKKGLKKSDQMNE